MARGLRQEVRSEASWVSGCGSVICNAGGPYSVACGGLATSIALDGSGSDGPPGSTLTYAWTTDCPGGTFDNAASATPTLTIPRNGACGLQCKVHLTATIGEEGVAECVADVTIADECSPAMVFLPGCPGDMSVEAADETGLVVEFSVPEVSGGCNPAVTTSPASGSTFPIGDTQVTITATDDSGIVLTCSFTVTVLPPAQPEAQPTPGQFHGCILFLFQSLFGIPLCGPCFVIGLVGTLVGLVDMKRRVRRWRR